MQALDQLPQLDDRLPRGGLGGIGQATNGPDPGCLPDHGELHDQRHQPGLGAVMQVSLDHPQGRGRVVHCVGPGLLQGPDPLGRQIRSE